MAFEIEFELTGLKLRVRGKRDEVNQLTRGLEKQLAHIVSPANLLVHDQPTSIAPTIEENGTPNGHDSKRIRRPSRSKSKLEESTIELQHDSSKWGTPLQSWPTLNKALWIMLVVLREKQQTQLNPGTISSTFNKHFMQAKTIRSQNVSRDLAKASDYACNNNGEFCLTQEGIKRAEELVKDAMSAGNTPT